MMISKIGSLTALAILGCAGLFAQPRITAVVNAADFASGVAYGSLGTIFGSGLSDKNYQLASLPLPYKLGPTEAFVCLYGSGAQTIPANGCEPLQVLFVSPAQINFLLFSAPPQKPGFGTQDLYVVVRNGGVVSEAAGTAPASRLPPSIVSPRIFMAGTDRYIDARFISPTTFQTTRGVISDQKGNLLNSTNPARIGQYYTIWMTGLGAFVNGKLQTALSMKFDDVPVFGYKGSTWFTAKLSYAGPSPQFPGVYQINFQLPPVVAEGKGSDYGSYFPCGDYSWEITLSITQQETFGTRLANPVQIPVVVKNGDIACAKSVTP
jgi:uncharacterized protein (TIGR03437 family)